MVRFLLNVGLYAIFGGALFAFAAMRGERVVAPLEVAVAVAAVALWSGGLTTATERLVPRLPAASTRVLAGAVLGALSLGGFALVLGLVVWRQPVPQLIALATVAGALMQAARTFAARPAGRAFIAAEVSSQGETVSAKTLIDDGALVIDVRTQAEWDAGHLPMARLLPIDQLESRLAEVGLWVEGDRGKPIVVYCRSGHRSGAAKDILAAAGFSRVTNGGGFQELRARS